MEYLVTALPNKLPTVTDRLLLIISQYDSSTWQNVNGALLLTKDRFLYSSKRPGNVQSCI